jgi:hypothetical protein
MAAERLNFKAYALKFMITSHADSSIHAQKTPFIDIAVNELRQDPEQF